MYTLGDPLAELESEMGTPPSARWTYEMEGPEFYFVKDSMRKGRAHDVTIFIVKDNSVALIQKWSYPEKVYRPPSGGAELGESLLNAARREAKEETGLDIIVKAYLYRVYVDFSYENEIINWTTHVFSAETIGGQLTPVDVKEIKTVKFGSVEEMNSVIKKAMLETFSTGLRYRSDLNDLILPILFPQYYKIP